MTSRAAVRYLHRHMHTPAMRYDLNNKITIPAALQIAIPCFPMTCWELRCLRYQSGHRITAACEMFWMLAANSGTEVRVGNKRTPSAQCRTSRARGTWFRQARLLDSMVNYCTRETIRPIVGQRDEFVLKTLNLLFVGTEIAGPCQNLQYPVAVLQLARQSLSPLGLRSWTSARRGRRLNTTAAVC